MRSTSEKALAARAQRAAQRIGLVARRWCGRRGSLENHGLFMLVDPASNIPVAGFRYDLTPDDVIAYCKD